MNLVRRLVFENCRFVGYLPAFSPIAHLGWKRQPLLATIRLSWTRAWQIEETREQIASGAPSLCVRLLIHRFGAELVCTILFGVLLAQPAWAALNADDPTLDSIIVVGTRLPTAISEGTDSVSIVTREQIDRMALTSGIDLLRQVPGLQIDQLGGPGGSSFAYIRGSDPNHVLVLVDGVRMNDPTNSRGGGFDVSNLEPSQIERIEVLREAASSIYGADAMGGVINVVTRKGKLGNVGRAGAGGLGYRSASARASTGGEYFRFSTAASSVRDGQDSNGGRLALDQISAAASLAMSPSAKVEVELRHGERKSSAFPDDSGGILLAQLRTLEQRQAQDTSMSVRAKWEFDVFAVNAAATGFERTENVDSSGVAPGLRSAIGIPASRSQTEFRRSNFLLNGVRHLPRGSELAIGVEVQREHGVSHTNYSLFGRSIPADFDLQRDTRSGFAEFKWLVAQDLVVRMGLRHDSVEGSESRTSPSLGARYNFPDLHASIKANYSEGFKPPSFFAMGLPIALGGNPHLRPESNKGASIGYEQAFWGGNANASIVAFDSKYANLITFDNQTNQLVNASRVNIYGAELELSVQVSESLRVHGTFTRLLSHIVDSNEPLRQRPGRRAGVQLDWSIDERSNLNWRVEYAAKVFDSSVPTGNVTLPAYVRNDVSYVIRMQKWLRLSTAVDNIFDRHNQSYIGALAPGRRLRFDVSVTF